MCLGMNPDQLGAGESAALLLPIAILRVGKATSAAPIFVSPAMAAAAAIAGNFVDTREHL